MTSMPAARTIARTTPEGPAIQARAFCPREWGQGLDPHHIHRLKRSSGNHERDERGSAALEAVIGVTAFGLFLAMTIAGGRVAISRQAVESAANDAARAASIARNAGEASADARTAAINNLKDQELQCTTMMVNVNTSGFQAPIGTTAQVTATVTCVVKLSDLAIPGLPGSRAITETVSSPIDAYREIAGGFTISNGVSAGNSRADS